ncbi:MULTISPECIES: hypothetical protein [Chryseobacterium]|nr:MULTISPECIES: hypothetical protein [Chryseobacterium]
MEGCKENSKYASRLTCCYGDLGIACVLYTIRELITGKNLVRLVPDPVK